MTIIKKLIIATALIGSLGLQDITLYAMASDTKKENEQEAPAAPLLLPLTRVDRLRTESVRPFLPPFGISELVSEYAQPTDEEVREANRTLFSASRAGNARVCELALENGADVNDTHRGGCPLARAIMSEQADTVSLLLAHNADANQGSGLMSMRPLCQAIESAKEKPGVLEIIRMLVFSGADPFLADETEPTVYMDMATPEIKAVIEQAQKLRLMLGDCCVSKRHTRLLLRTKLPDDCIPLVSAFLNPFTGMEGEQYMPLRRLMTEHFVNNRDRWVAQERAAVRVHDLQRVRALVVDRLPQAHQEERKDNEGVSEQESDEHNAGAAAQDMSESDKQ